MLKFLTVTLISLILFSSPVFSETLPDPPSKKTIKQWLHKKEWAGGITQMPHSSTNLRLFYEQYHANKAAWDSAFAFFKKPLETMAPGTYTLIPGVVTATLSETKTKSKEEAKWESHRQFIDIQYTFGGKEIIGMTDSSKATVIQEYKPDIMFYKGDGKFYTSDPQHFFLMFPTDLHMPVLKTEGYDVIKKLVIKVAVAK